MQAAKVRTFQLIGHQEQVLLQLEPTEESGVFVLKMNEPIVLLTRQLLDELSAMCLDALIFSYYSQEEKDEEKEVRDDRTPDRTGIQHQTGT